MPTTYTIDDEHRVVFNRIWGVMDDPIVLRHSTAIRNDPRFNPDYGQLLDLRAVTRFALTTGAIRANADFTPYGPEARRAIVVVNEPEFGLARLFQMSLGDSGDRVLVTRDLAAALGWLGLDPTEPLPERIDRLIE